MFETTNQLVLAMQIHIFAESTRSLIQSTNLSGHMINGVIQIEYVV